MSLQKHIDNFARIGVKPDYQSWEVFLTRKINLVALIGFFNVTLAIIFFLIKGYYYFIPECILVILASPLVIIFNKYKNYVWGAYVFYFIGYVFFFFLILKMGKDSYSMLFFFPIIISMVQLLGRKELLKHLAIQFILCFLTIALILFGLSRDFLLISTADDISDVIKYLNILLCFSVTISFIGAVVYESAKQEQLIKGMLREKEILLAEVFHRVKNNMTIITSLLSLKKDASDSAEAKEALEECRNRVFSMALVHQNIYSTKNLTNLDLKEYLHDLMDELLNSMGNNNKIEAFIDCDEINLELTQAVPFGLITNELITNAFKYALSPDKKLRIDIRVKKDGKTISVKIKDNGPGFDTMNEKKNSLGMDLIKSLSEQIDGTYFFKSNNGLEFNLSFQYI